MSIRILNTMKPAFQMPSSVILRMPQLHSTVPEV